MPKHLAHAALLAVFLPGIGACGGPSGSGGDLHARQVEIRREVEGLRAVVARLERNEPMLPQNDVIVAIDESLVRDMIGAQLPLELDVDRYHLTLREAEVHFRGSPGIRLRGTLSLKNRQRLSATVNVVGALGDIAVDATASTLKGTIAIDHLGIETAAGLESILGGSTLDEVARMIRLQIKDQMPSVQIPVKVQQVIDLPAVTRGPVRIDGARMPLKVAVSEVLATRSKLWVAVHFEPGAVTKTTEAPAVGDATAADAEVSLGDDEAPAKGPAKPGGKGRGK